MVFFHKAKKIIYHYNSIYLKCREALDEIGAGVRKNANFSKRKSLISTFTDLQSSRKRQSSSDSSECSDGNISLHDSTDLDSEGEDLARKVEALNQKKNANKHYV